MKMYEIDMEIGGDRKGYWALLRFEDRQGKPHRREIKKEPEGGQEQQCAPGGGGSGEDQENGQSPCL